MTVRWASDFSEPSPLKGHCSADTTGWCNAQIVRAEQIQIEPPFARFETRHGDKYSSYSDSRALLTGPFPTLWAHEGDELYVPFTVKFPAGFVSRYPKQDELQSWIANPTGGAFLTGGSILIWHHDMGGAVEEGSAPVYVIASDGKVRLQVVDQITSSPTFSAPLQVQPMADIRADVEQSFILGGRFSTDRVKGWVQAFDGAGNELTPRVPHTTIRPGSVGSYLSVGIYRRDTIGDGQYVWPADAVNGIAYPSGFVPAKGQKVYPNGDGYPGVVRLGRFKLTTTKAEAMATPATTTPTPPVVTAPGATPANFDPSQPSVNPNAGAKVLMAARDAMKAQIAAIDAELNKGGYRP